ncbi:MAG: DUF763 domain-containing protein [Bacteroidota bacterium]
MKKSGYADLPLHGGKVPAWLYQRMSKLGGAIVEYIVSEYGKSEVLRRLSDPYWFQSFGAVLGMDWHSSGITTSVMGTLKSAITPMSNDLGLFICGGRGKHSRQTPNELIVVSGKTGINGDDMLKYSKLTAKIDNTAIQDGFQLYLHSFIVTDEGEWAVVQQGMNGISRFARRYHWHSGSIKSFVEEPHTAVCGENQGLILNLTHKEADITRKGILHVTREAPSKMMNEIKHLKMPLHHDVQLDDIDLKRLGTIIALAHEQDTNSFENLLLINGLGPKTLRSLALVSEVVHGTPSRFSDPARFSFAHGGKDRKPYPVQTHVYDDTIEFLKKALDKSRIDHSDKKKAFNSLYKTIGQMEKNFTPEPGAFEKYKKKENDESHLYGGRSVLGKEPPPKGKMDDGQQLKLF